MRPNIEDTGRDGTDHRLWHRAYVEAGYAPLADYIACPAAALKRSLDTGESSANAASSAPVPFHHETSPSPEEKHSHDQ